uniref:Mariner Mos1 transposase n=1 Tax=Myotis myotis TaxID=51298 RepID=A0A7J8AN34_MYOMY|nr:hypothetical protein mMyoMyo1_008114 [Myotis myotis]
MKSGFILRIPNTQNHGLIQVNHQHRLQGQMLCTWWDQEGVVYYELLKPGETINTDRYRQQIINLNHDLIMKRPECARKHDKVILPHDDTPSHTSKPVKDTLKDLAWEVLTHRLYSPDLAPADYHLLRYMAHALSQQHFKTY